MSFLGEGQEALLENNVGHNRRETGPLKLLRETFVGTAGRCGNS